MLNASIGESAGKVWQALNSKGKLNFNSIMKNTGLDEKKLYLALGWLAREEKINFEKKLNQTIVSLSGK